MVLTFFFFFKKMSAAVSSGCTCISYWT